MSIARGAHVGFGVFLELLPESTAIGSAVETRQKGSNAKSMRRDH